MENEKYEIIEFKDGDFSLNVNVNPDENTVWLNRRQISELFERDIKTIGKHINSIMRDEYNNDTSLVAFFATTGNDGKTYNVEYYNLDVIISVGYRVNSKRGIMFRKWANQVLKQHLLNGYSINENRIIQYQSNILMLEANVENIENRLRNLEQTIYVDNNRIIFEGVKAENLLKDI